MSNAAASTSDLVDVRVCPLDDIPLGLGRAFAVGGKAIAIFRLRTGEVHALADRCPHRGGPLADGMVAGNRVVCPFHAFRYDLDSGRCDQPDVCGVEVFAARVECGWIVLRLPAEKNC